MTDPNEGVAPSDSPTDPNADPDVTSSAAAVSAVDDDVQIGDRPLKNIIAELDRKNEARLNQIKAEMLSALGTIQRPAPAAPAQREYSDEELAQLAAAGDARALQTLTDRQSARHADERMRTHATAQAEQAQLAALFGRYPVLRDGTHQLTQYAMQVKSALIANGYRDTVATVIEAVKTAIADNPALAAQSVAATPSTAAPRPSAAPTGAAATPTARRPAAPAKAPVLTDAQWALAKRYGYKTREDAAKALANHERRKETGQSRLGAVGAMIREDA